jgi:hypothetical protein
LGRSGVGWGSTVWRLLWSAIWRVLRNTHRLHVRSTLLVWLMLRHTNGARKMFLTLTDVHRDGALLLQ